VNSLTGPVLRGDISTIEKHISVIDKEDKELYKILSLNLLNLVALRENNNINKSEIEQGNFENIEKENVLQNLLNNSEKHSEIYKLLGGLD
jgi:hypothetical protein